MNTLLSFLSLDYSGLVLALLLFGAAVFLIRKARSRIVKWPSWIFAAATIVLLLGSVSHLVRVAEIDDRFPAPGKMVDIGGYKVHVLAEGPNDGPAIVWFAGGHTGGLGNYQHHAALRDEVRSILIDRPGTGWSEAGPFPRSTAAQAEEMMRALEASGEKGPFIFAGHSFGGLLAINVARRYPDRTAALVMMDATPLDVIVYGLDKDTLRGIQKMGLGMTLKQIFGFYHATKPLDADGNDDVNYSNPMQVMQYIQSRARFGVATYSAFEELTPEGLDDRAFETMTFDGELGDIPLYLVAPKDEDPTTKPYSEMVAGGPGRKAERFAAFLKATRERYMRASTNSIRVVAPPGSGHNFVNEDPEFVINAVRDVVRAVVEKQAEYKALTTNWPGPHGGFPPIDLATPENMEAAYVRAIAEKRQEVATIVRSTEPATFENTILALESSGLALARIQQLLTIFTSTASNPDIAAVAARTAPLAAEIDDEVAHNRVLFERVREVYSGLPDSAPDEEARRLVAVMHDNMVRSGAALSGVDKIRLTEINAKLAEQITRFGQNSRNDEAQLVVFVDSVADLDGLPDPQIAAAKAAAEAREEPTKWAIPISRPNVWPLLTHAHDRSLREVVWRKWVTRGGNDGEYDNGPVMTKILRLRGDKATLLGFPTFAHYQTAARMAGTPEIALNMLMRAWKSLEDPTIRDIAKMQAIANAEGADFELQPWDRLYYTEKLKQQEFNFNTGDVLPYFELNNIVAAMTWAAGQVYEFEFRELHDVAVVSPDIRVFEVLRGGEVTGVIWMDLFAREGKGPSSWAAQYRSEENFRGKQIPLVVLHSAAQKPPDGGPVLVPWERANVIFHEFGHTLQMLSNSASYPSLGALNVPWDFVEVPSLLNERWFMTDEVLSRFALHHETHEPMPAELLAKLRRSLMQDRVFSATQSFLGTAVVDMRLHLLADGREIDAEAVEAEVIAELDMPQAMDLILYVPHAFHTFSPQYAAGVYTYLWSDIIAADIADAFLEAPGGLYDRGVARRYRSQILDIGNTKPVEEAFRDFRGRDPDPNALMRRFDLL